MSKYLIEKGCRVIGVEVDEEEGKKSSNFGNRVCGNERKCNGII